MAEVGRAALRDPGALLPGGFWAAVAVWLERPQVANKRLCGARLEARRSATLRLAEARGPRSLAGPEQEERGAAGHRPEEGLGPGQRSPEEGPGLRPSAGPKQEKRGAAGRGPEEGLGPGQRSPEEGPGLRPSAGPEQEERGAAGRGPEEGLGPGQRSAEEGPGPRPSAGPEQGMARRGRQETQGPHQQGEARREAAEAPLLAVDPGHPDKARGGADNFAVADLDLLWDNFSRSLASGNPEMLAFLLHSGEGLQPEEQHELDVVFRTVIPKTSPHCQLTSPRREIVVQDVLSGAVTFLPLEEDDEGNLKVKMSNVYQIQLSHSKEEWFISVLIFCPERWHSDGIVYPKPTWLGEELLGRLARWSVEDKKSEFKSTLSLISIMKYSKVYRELKEKYKEMVKVWPEVTDPEKFVYEDVAIATYLLILWDEERAESGITAKQSFVDLGCGNGLLVHILSSEGHPGRGIDVRRRKIWDMYGPQTQLEFSLGDLLLRMLISIMDDGLLIIRKGAITPNNETLFPDVDWLIGNHSDELTPWIPVIAARSSYSCRFFILPCCFFDFIGKYHRRQSKKTQYREYLDFITEVGSTCGFRVEEDCLRIPSTKRVCLIGKSRTYPPTGEVFIDEQRTQYINSRQGHPVSRPGREPAPAAARLAASGAGHRDGHGAVDAGVERVSEAQAAERKAGPQVEGLWLPGFHPREKAECTRNCASLSRDFIDQVVLQVANLLLGGKQLDPRSSQNGSLESWNGGESLSLAEVARELDKETLQRLKRECGGLQTLLRNSHQVFEVQNGRVHIRDWREERLRKKTHPEAKRRLFSDALKTRICWFFTHHPDGCPLPSDCCPFAHGPGELRPSQTPKKKKQSL